MKTPLLLLTVLLVAALPTSAQRKPLNAPRWTAIPHQPTGLARRYNPQTNSYSNYALDGRIELRASDEVFLVSWNGEDGSRREVVYDPPMKAMPTVAATVSFDSLSGLYTYTYTVSNAAAARQPVYKILIEGATQTSIVSPDDTWYSYHFTDFLREKYAVTDGWGWTRTGDTLGIRAGSSISGLQLVSPRPPAVVHCWAGARGRLPDDSADMPEELRSVLWDKIYELPSGWTIGPDPIEAKPTASAEAARLDQELQLAERQGWLGSPAVAKELRSAAASIREALAVGKTAAARATASSLLQRLKDRSVAGLENEALGLLSYHLDRLRRQGLP